MVNHVVITNKNYNITFDNVIEYQGLKKEIFDQHAYYFETDLVSPLIFDLGAHIGLSSLYFKMLYPQSEIIAVEPMPANVALFQENMSQNFIENVQLITQAIATHSGQVTLYIDTSDSWYSTASFSKGAWTKDQPTVPILVPTITLKDLITQNASRPIDLLKMDIEGAEFATLCSAGAELRQIKELILEYHPQPKQDLQTMILHLQQYGLKLETKLSNSRKKPNKLLLLRFVRT